MKFGWLGLGAVIVLGVASGCVTSAPEDESVGESSQAIQGGTTDTTHTFAVGVCLGGRPGECQGTCSGALIAPNVVVTARHCVSQSPELIDCSKKPTFGGQAFGSFNVTTDTSMRQSNKGWHAVKAVNIPTDDHVCGNDIALLILNDLVSPSEATPIVPGVQYPMSKSGYARSFTAVGYGLTSTSQSKDDSGTRRIRSGINVLCIPNVPLFNCPSIVHEREFVGGDGVCQGDSGSSAYESTSFNKANGAGAISFGVLSRGGQDGNNCVGSIYTRLDSFRDLVVQTVEQASNNWKLYAKPDPDWTEYVPPPAPKDAGAKDSGGSTSKAAPFGDVCSKDADCSSGVCAKAADDSKFCSKSCTKDTSCPSGYTCQEEICQAATDATTDDGETSTRSTSSGCSAGRSRETTPWVGLGMVALGAAYVGRRRRGNRQ